MEGPSSEPPPTARVKRSCTASPSGAFSTDWEELFLFLELSGGIAQCLVCHSNVQIKQSTLKRHYTNQHAAKYGTTTGNDRVVLIEKLKAALPSNQGAEFSSEAAVRVTYLVAFNIAKAGKPFTEGEFLKQNMISAAEVLCPSELYKFKALSLSANTVSRRVVEIGADLRQQLKDLCSQFVFYSLALDESTDKTDTAELCIFIRGVLPSLRVVEELLDLVPLKDTTTGDDIFKAVEEVMESMNLALPQLCSLATDGASAMIGTGLGFAGRMQRKVKGAGLPPIAVVRCLLHQEQLCAKSCKDDFDSVMTVVVRCVNFCRRQGLNHRQFRELLKDLDVHVHDIPYHCAVRWLSCGTVLRVFFEILPAIVLFMDMKGSPEPLLADPSWVMDLAFFADITGHLNDLNVNLQGRNKLVNSMWDRVKAFKLELDLFAAQLHEKNFQEFPALQTLSVPSTVSMDKHVKYISNLKGEFNRRFTVMGELEMGLSLFATPFSAKTTDVPQEFQRELIRLQCDSVLRDRFYNFSSNSVEFYKNVPQQEYPRLFSSACRFIAMFGSTYVCEQFFSLLTLQKSNVRTSLSDAALNAILRIHSSHDIQPNFQLLVASKKCQVSSQQS